MAIFQRIEQSDGQDSLTILFSDATITSVGGEHPSFQALLDALDSGSDDATLKGLLDPASYIAGRTAKISERFTLAGGTLLFDGDPIEGALADFIVSIAQKSDNPASYRAYVNFAEKLAQNPSQESRDHLFKFVAAHGLTITPEGDVVLYKGVKADGGSIHEGPGLVNGVQMNGSLPNEVGSILEFPRSKVDANRGVACSTGLHAGTFAYASSFSQGRLLTVAVNPRDVVSVPSDHGDAKVRVSRYVVVEVNVQDRAYDTPVWGDTDDDDDWSDYDEDEDDDLADSGEGRTDESDPDEDDTPVFTAVAGTNPDAFEDKVLAFLVKIPVIIKGGWDKSISLYISKHVTAANRDAAREALRRTGLR